MTIGSPGTFKCCRPLAGAMERYSRNIPLLYVYSMFLKRVVIPILALYFLLNQLSFTQIGILGASMSLAHLLCEVPAGVFADKYGRKRSLLIHSSLGALTMLLYWLGNSFWPFLIASVAYGVAGAFLSGSRQALMFDSLKAMKREREFKQRNGGMLLYSHLVNACVLLFIPWLYSLDAKLPFLIGIAFELVGLLIALFLIEAPLSRRQSRILDHLGDAAKEIKRNVLPTFLLIMTIGSFYLMSVDYVPPLLEISRLDIIYFGIVFFLMRILKGAAAGVTYKLERFMPLKGLIYLGVGLTLLGFFAFSLGTGLLIVGGIILSRLAEGINRVTLEDELNQKIDSRHRATVMSLSMLSQQLGNVFIVVIVGIGADLLGLQGAMTYASIALLILTMAALAFLKNGAKVAQ